MQAIKEHKLYDTDTAEKLGEWETTPYWTDFDYYCEELYRTPKGNYFLLVTTYRDNKCITPITSNEALEWLEHNNCCADTIIKYFPEMIQDA